MQVQDVIEWVRNIEAIAHDDEVAHSSEDALYLAVLECIAAGEGFGSDLAREALKARELEFARWCA